MWDRATPDLRSKMVRTAGTWQRDTCLPADVLAAVTAKMQPAAAAPQQQSLLVVGASGAAPAVHLPSAQYVTLNASGQPVILAGGGVPGAGAWPGVVAGGGAGAVYGGVLLPAVPPAVPPVATAPAAAAHPALVSLGQQLAAATAAAVAAQQQKGGRTGTTRSGSSADTAATKVSRSQQVTAGSGARVRVELLMAVLACTRDCPCLFCQRIPFVHSNVTASQSQTQ
jgi:hypothetical protein